MLRWRRPPEPAGSTPTTTSSRSRSSIALYRQLDLIEIDDGLVRRAGALAEQHAPRGYDAGHLAGVERLIDEDLVLVAGDPALCDAGRSLGLVITDTSPRRS